MLLTLTTTHAPAPDLGYLLAKNPARSHVFELGFGRATVFFPEVSEDRCTAALLVEVDAVDGVRGRRADDDARAHAVDDRAWAASSLLSVALGRVFGTALAGRSRERPALARAAIPLEATVAAVRCRGGEGVVRRLFEPLGWTVTLADVPAGATMDRLGEVPSDDRRGGGRSFDVTLTGTARVADLLTHLCVLIPVLDDPARDRVGPDELEKLLAHGGAWLAAHPERELVVGRYLEHRRVLDLPVPPTAGDDPTDPRGLPGAEDALEAPLRLADARLDAVHRTLRLHRVRSVADVGCGEGRLVARLARDPDLRRVVGVEPSLAALARARARLDPERVPARVAERVSLLHGSATYRDPRLDDLDAICLVEVLEHVDLDRLPALEDAIFAAARPRLVLATTPNAEYNVLFEDLAPGAPRHRDHRFEWTRAEFRTWARGVAERHGYAVAFEDVGAADPERGAPTQLAAWSR